MKTIFSSYKTNALQYSFSLKVVLMGDRREFLTSLNRFLIVTAMAPRPIQSISCNASDLEVSQPPPVTPKRREMETSSQRHSSLNSQNKNLKK